MNNARKELVRKRIREADGSRVEVISAKPVQDVFSDEVLCRVAVYVRVSTDDASQTSSFEIQKKYYEQMTEERKNWILVGIYADEGISGTSMKKRDEFKRMIADCEAGKIGLIITKSTSRWSRNILDAIGMVEHLAGLNPPVGVFFENEGMFSLNPDHAMGLRMTSTLAEHESRTKSGSMVSSLKMRFSNALFLTPPLLGFDVDPEARGGLAINEDEAATVRLIFFMYLAGFSTAEIADALMAHGRRTKLGNKKWTAGTVLSVLRNERHCGEVLAWKTYTPSFLSQKSLKNKGERPQYRAVDNHEGIISRNDFLTVQKMIDNAKYGGTFAPKLRVDADGVLAGFVAVTPRWQHSAEDYMAASKGALSEA